jgi:hypothetical protein
MQVDYMVIADAAAAENGKHYIHGGGWDTIFAASYPVVHPSLGVAVRLRVPWNDTNTPHEIMVDIVDADGNSIFPDPPGTPHRSVVNVGRPPTVPVGNDQTIALAFPFAYLNFQHEGDYVLVLRLDGIDAARSPFHVVSTPPAAPAPGAP